MRGLVNIQFAVKDGVVYVIEANPRASRTVPFIAKATGVPLAKLASRIMAGEKLTALKLPEHFAKPGRYFVKEAVMPFGRFPGDVYKRQGPTRPAFRCWPPRPWPR